MFGLPVGLLARLNFGKPRCPLVPCSPLFGVFLPFGKKPHNDFFIFQ
jgi:hypothetical protein